MILKNYIEFINEDYKDPNTYDGHYYVKKDNTKIRDGKIAQFLPDTVTGNFECINLELKTLEGVSKYIGNNFNCNGNILTNLKGGPLEVENEYHCQLNVLTSLEGAPKHMPGSFDCSGNHLETFEGGPDWAEEFIGSQNEYLTSLRGSPKSIGGSFIIRDCTSLESLEGVPEVIMKDMIFKESIKLKSLYGLTHRIGRVLAPVHLKIEEDFLNNYEMAVLHKGNYWKELLNFVIKNSRDINSVNWPDGFITDDIRKSAVTTHKYNL